MCGMLHVHGIVRHRSLRRVHGILMHLSHPSTLGAERCHRPVNPPTTPAASRGQRRPSTRESHTISFTGSSFGGCGVCVCVYLCVCMCACGPCVLSFPRTAFMPQSPHTAFNPLTPGDGHAWQCAPCTQVATSVPRSVVSNRWHRARVSPAGPCRVCRVKCSLPHPHNQP